MSEPVMFIDFSEIVGFVMLIITFVYIAVYMYVKNKYNRWYRKHSSSRRLYKQMMAEEDK